MKMKHLISCAALTVATSLISPAAFAQTLPTQGVMVEDLGAAQAYDVGVIEYGQGALGPTLWNGTSVTIAQRLIADAPIGSSSAATLDLVANTLLTGGTPPNGAQDDEQAYVAMRLGKLISMGRADEAAQILSRLPNLASSPLGQQINADKALGLGQNEQACTIADNAQEARSEPYWAKLRAFCHVLRGEIPAAELTADLLRRTGHEAPEFYKALLQSTGVKSGDAIKPGNDALLLAMDQFVNSDDAPTTLSAQQTLDKFISDAPSLSTEAFAARMNALSLTEKTEDADPENAGYFDLEVVIDSDHPSSWGKLYGVVKTGTDAAVTAKAGAALLERAQTRGVLNVVAKNIASDIALVPAQLKAEYSPDIFSRLAVMNGDLSSLRAMYDAVPNDDERKTRIALASDALGNGFILGTLGQDMTQRLQERGAVQRRAVRDTFIAVALGARLPDEAIIALSDYNGNLVGRGARQDDLLLLQAAAARGAKAETALRSAAILGENGPQGLRADALGEVLKALYAAGLTDYAGRLAAEDFIEQ